MKIGVFLTIEAYSEEHKQNEKYRCKVVDKDNKYLYIDYPVHLKMKRTSASFRVGTRMKAEYLGDDQSVYRFKTEVKKRNKGKIPTLALEIPESDKIERIQRREYVRIETAVDVALHSVYDNFAPFATVSVDLSGGGLSVVVPKDIHINDGEEIMVHLVLPMQSGEYHYLELKGEIIRLIHNVNSANTASIKLKSLDELDKQIIIRFCFEKQREARQKEMH
ncbi:flagellar brake protein [Ornithinibacillus scapharcae]|uniref:flagellar brake protein n=1 Tax=Ornithinibacillus scapharcae TaxID=1147159 RepID=UPI000225BB9D|nr:flagellar brake domain-containing protein [Ornithinibacillus scapharcae]